MTCGGCEVVANYTTIIFGLTSTVSPTGPVGSFTYSSDGLITYRLLFLNEYSITFCRYPLTRRCRPSPTVTIISPTAYLEFRGITEFSFLQHSPPGSCITLPATTSMLSSAYLVPIPASAGSDFIFEAEISFINHIGGLTCAPGSIINSTSALPFQTSAAPSESSIKSSAAPSEAPTIPSMPPTMGGLSVGAKIGIGVSIPTCIIAGLFLLSFMLLRRRHKRRLASPRYSELEGRAKHELEGKSRFEELDGRLRHELVGDSVEQAELSEK